MNIHINIFINTLLYEHEHLYEGLDEDLVRHLDEI